MTNYETFDTEDFLQDDFFISWVLHPSAAENDFWLQWISKHPERKIFVEQARVVLLGIKANGIADPVTDADVKDILNYIDINAYQKQPRLRGKLVFMYKNWGRVAAVLILGLATALFYYNTKTVNKKPIVSEQQLVQWIECKNESGQSSVIRMLDGSLAVLKPHSTLKYPSEFSDTTRDVFLEGEAFFEVHKNPAKAFLVHSKGMITKVLGTSFAVRAFEKEKIFKVVVSTGKVMVYTAANTVASGQGSQAILLLPHQEALLRRTQSQFVKDTIAAPMMLAKETAKKEFSFYKATIPEVIQKLEEAYHVKITYNSQQFANVTVTAGLSDLPLDEKVKFICKAVDAQYSFNDGQITIEKR